MMEMLLVVAILGLVAGLAFPALQQLIHRNKILAWMSHPMSYCAARLHAISGRPRSSLGDTIPSCPQQVRLLRSSLR
ncbi:MAG: hypothetical protein V3T81_01380, partial [Thermoanaerobaculia bacterium]